jgi:hypothetical protein
MQSNLTGTTTHKLQFRRTYAEIIKNAFGSDCAQRARRQTHLSPLELIVSYAGKQNAIREQRQCIAVAVCAQMVVCPSLVDRFEGGWPPCR